MTTYTIYLPMMSPHGPVNNKINPEHTYVTDVLAYELKKYLRILGIKSTIAYIPLETHNDKLPTQLCIDELNLNITVDGSIPTSLWMMIANDQTKKFCLVDLQDAPCITMLLNDCSGYVMSLVGQFNLERYLIDSPTLDLTKIIPFVYLPYYPVLTESYIERIQDIRLSNTLDDRVLFFGNNQDSYVHSNQKIREVISYLEDLYPDEVRVGSTEKKLPLTTFWEEAAKHTISLALPGHPWCSREHELWTLGLPVMMYEHTHHMCISLIPNYHYVAVAGGQRLTIGMAQNPEKAAHQIMKTHREWIKPENRWRLDNIARNGQIRMMTKASPTAIIPKLIELLQLGHW